jgi:hypothetical protein
MSQPHDDWDAEERDALEGLDGELTELRRKHQDDPSLAMLRAADADALPPEQQARVARHLRDSAWSRAVVDGLRDTGVDDRLDAAAEDRLLARITREADAAAIVTSRRRWTPAIAIGGLAIAATVLIAVMVSSPASDMALVPDEAPASPIAQATPDSSVPRITFAKPEIKLSPSALAWRGDASANPFVRDLAPAIEAYRAGDHAQAVTAFDRLAASYPDSIEVLFYQGVSRMLAGDDAGAVAPLEAAARLNNTTFADDVAWYLAVARQRSGRSEVRATFEELCRGQGAYAASACAAVQQLDSSAVPKQP